MGDLRVGGSAGAAAVMATDEMIRGDKGEAVRELQQLLKDAGYNLKVDGDWQGETDQAVRAFQKDHGLVVDGIVGDQTKAALTRETKPETSAAPSGHLDLRQELSSPNSRLSVAIGMAEGTRTKGGGYTSAYQQHIDPIKSGQNGPNKGTFSYQGAAATPAIADQKQLASMQQLIPKYEEACRKANLDPTNPVLAGSCFDLFNQAPAAVTAKGGFLDQLPKLKEKGLTPDNIAEARYRSYYDPDGKRMDTNFATTKDGQSSPDLKADQQRRTNEIFKGLADYPATPGQPASAPANGSPVSLTDFPRMKQMLSDKVDQFLQKATSGPSPEQAKDPASKPLNAATIKHNLNQDIDAMAKAFGANPKSPELAAFRKEADAKVDQFCKAAGIPATGHTPVPPGKIGFGSEGESVRELKQALADGGFYKGAINGKMGEDGCKALADAKAALKLGGPGDVAGPDTIEKIKRNAEWPTLRVEVPHLSQPVGSVTCDDYCEAMMQGLAVPGNADGYIDPFRGGKNDPTIRYVESELKAGRPVMIGVYHDSAASGNSYDIKHFLVATGTGRDSKGPYISFNDPAQQTTALGKDTNPDNRLYLTADKGFSQQGVADPYQLKGVVRQLSDTTPLTNR